LANVTTNVIASEAKPANDLWRTSSLLLLAMTIGSLFIFSGCGEIQAPTARQALTHPFGTCAPFTLGTSQQEVLESWGPPDQRIPRGVDELGNVREEWIYRGRIENLPIDYEYMSRTKHLSFEGKNLVRCESEDPPEEKR